MSPPDDQDEPEAQAEPAVKFTDYIFGLLLIRATMFYAQSSGYEKSYTPGTHHNVK
jgi:hypothetical protein